MADNTKLTYKADKMKILSLQLTMTQITEHQWPLFERLHQDSEVIKFCFDQAPTEEIRSKFVSRLTPWSPSSKESLCLVITEKKSALLVGVTGFKLINGIAEVGYLLLPEFYRQGYATESLCAVIEWAIAEHNITEFKAIVTAGNVGSERVLTKCGFELTKTVPNAYEIAGKRYADHIYSLSTEM